MNVVHRLAEKIRKGERIPAPVAVALSAATPFWRLGMWRRKRLPRVRVNAQVVSFGNITAGGTGKTPAVIERARLETEAGRRVAVLTRGYGAERGRGVAVVEAGNRLGDWLGDEPELIVRLVGDVVIARGADRVAAARRAIDEFGCDLLLLDDGFQYLALERDENVLVIDAANPFGNERLLPRGILREPVEEISRATHIILTRCDQVEDCGPLLARLGALCPGVPVRQTCHAPTRLWKVADGGQRTLEELRGTRVRAVCGIGNPDAFIATLESLGADVVERRVFPDHAEFSAESLESPLMIVTTEKDAVRLKSAPENVAALGIELRDI